MRNFKMGTAKEEYNTSLERPLLELFNELLHNFKEYSVLPLGGAKQSTYLFKINFIRFPVMFISGN